MQVDISKAGNASPRPAARALRISSSFKALDSAGSGADTPTKSLLAQASDIISRSVQEPTPLVSPRSTQQQTAEATIAGGIKLRSCLSLKGRSESPERDATELARVGTQSNEHKWLHWKPELVAPSAVDQKAEAREMQARYLKLEGDLQDAEAAKAMLQKQLHRVQEAVVHSRDEMESAQRLALAAEGKAAAAEARAVAAETQSYALSEKVECLGTLL